VLGEDKASTKTDETSKEDLYSEEENRETAPWVSTIFHRKIAIDVGSFSIETDVDNREDRRPQKGKYKVSGKHVNSMMRSRSSAR
jgi:hypothetical protein